MDYIYIGRVANTHGVRGAIKVFPTTDDPTRFRLLKKITIEDARGTDHIYHISNVKYVNKFVVLELREVTDMDSAILLKKGIVKIERKYALPLEEDEYYIQDIVGLKVIREDGSHLGTLSDVIFTGNNDVYVVDLVDGGEVLLPVIKECVLNIDLEQGLVTVHVMEGLM